MNQINAVWVTLLLQMLLLIAFIVLPFGFDQRSWLGLDFEHRLLIGAGFIGAWFIGTTLAIVYRSWGVLSFQLILALGIAVFVVLLSQRIISIQARTSTTPFPVPNRPPLVRQI